MRRFAKFAAIIPVGLAAYLPLAASASTITEGSSGPGSFSYIYDPVVLPYPPAAAAGADPNATLSGNIFYTAEGTSSYNNGAYYNISSGSGSLTYTLAAAAGQQFSGDLTVGLRVFYGNNSGTPSVEVDVTPAGGSEQTNVDSLPSAGGNLDYVYVDPQFSVTGDTSLTVTITSTKNTTAILQVVRDNYGGNTPNSPDALEFSGATVAVPEPATLSIAALLGGGLLMRRRRRA